MKLDKIKKNYIWITIGAIIVMIFAARGAVNVKNILFKGKKDISKTQVVSDLAPVKVYKIKRMDFKDTLPALGTLKGYKEVPLKFQLSGIVESFNFEEGERIQEGDIIANLDQRDALLKLKYAELDLRKSKKMHELGAITEDALEKAKLEYESAKSDLEKTNTYAVSDGVLGSQDVYVGTYVTPNDRIGLFANLTKVYAEFNIIEKDVPKLKLGQKCEIFVDAIPKKDFIGTIDTISPLIEGRTRTQRVRVELRNPEELLKPGMFIRGVIATYEKKDALIIPASGLKKSDKGYYVYIVHEEVEEEEPEGEKVEEKLTAEGIKTGVVEVRPIQVGYMTQDLIEVSKGLEEGEMVAIELYQDLQDKEKVEIAEVQEMLY